ncbi:unnamed protein product [Paramecium primaurelia]|uniref:transketolase n=1 Tax=Paramecium primaurelia TaxID=5886 RepID=A0A8S1P985_PARPR|nr:unnamed protein product [Paramecium primaurelia]
MSDRVTRKGKSQPQKEEPKQAKKQKVQKETYDVAQLQDIAHQLRIHSIEMTIASNSGHPTSCASMAEIMAVLFFTKAGMHFNPKDPGNFGNDRFVLSKGHAAPILYAAWSMVGYIDSKELLNLRKIDSILEGHPVPKLPFVDVATGSLGQGLSVAGGMAYSSKFLDKINNRYWVLMGDGEIAEGSVWEAAHLASHYKLDNITAIVDVNRLGQSEETSIGHDVNVYRKRWEAFGWKTFVIDGHNLNQLTDAFDQCRNVKNQPQVIIAKTFKGKYLEMENKEDWHGKPVPQAQVDFVKKQMKQQDGFTLTPVVPTQIEKPQQSHFTLEVNYAVDGKQSTREAYGKALVGLSKTDANQQIVAVDGDTKNSTFSIKYKEAVPTNFVECFIAEQNMVGWAQGFSCRGKVAFASTFAAFFARGFDQIRMGGISGSQVKYIGSHAGVSIGEDGPSQMGLEDIAMFRTIPNCVVLYPSDGVSAERAIELVANHKSPCYVRMSRPSLPILYSNNEVFEIGKSKILKQNDDDKILLIGGGVTTHEIFKAAKQLSEQDKINVTVLDLFSVKPIDHDGILNAANKTSLKTILVVEDHYSEGGLFEAVSSCLSLNNEIKIHSIHVDKVAKSGTPAQMLSLYHLDAAGIIVKVKSIIQ